MPDLRLDQIAKLKQSIATLEEQQRALGADLSTSIQLQRELLAQLEQAESSATATLSGSGAVAQGTQAKAAGEHGIAAESIGGNAISGDENISAGGHVIIAEKGATVVVGELPVKMTAVERESALGRYLEHIISRNRYLQLQGIRSGGKLVSIELEQIYVTLRATRERTVSIEDEWLKAEATFAPGEMGRRHEPHHVTTEPVTVSVNEALGAHARLVVLGDPGSGKTTLLRYLALLYARDIAERTTLVRDKLGLSESGYLPILLPLRQIGAFLTKQTNDGTEGHALLLEFLFKSLHNERIDLLTDFFDDWLKSGRAVILLDGLDEVADPDLRRRVSRLVEDFTRAYPKCRYGVTSRVVGYTGPTRLAEDYATTTVRDFTLADVERFLTHWHRLVAIGQMGPGDSAESYARDQTQQLLSAIRGNDRIRELAINPLMLTVIAMVHRDRVKLPDRRAELYAEAVDVLLGKWDESRGLQDIPILENRSFDTGDKRVMLQQIALKMHEHQLKEVTAEELQRWLTTMFLEVTKDQHATERAVERFLHVIEGRTGLLIARGEGVYAFSHLTFQEYLAALAVASRDDYIAYALKRASDNWWREVILLETGYLSSQSKERVTRLIQSLIKSTVEVEPYHNLVLAAECLRDVGENRVQGDLQSVIQEQLHQELDPLLLRPLKLLETLLSRGRSADILTKRRRAAAEALARIGGRNYWTVPYGEPDWVTIPAGEFEMGTPEMRTFSSVQQFKGKPELGRLESPRHKVTLPTYAISRCPITNAQYSLFVQATQHEPPDYWDEGYPSKNKESHPVVLVYWHDAIAYCKWLSQMTNKRIMLPSEAEWEKAARGDRDTREFPWGDSFEATRCNSRNLDLADTTPVGVFLNGSSPYGVLDLSGNVWEWTTTILGLWDEKKKGIVTDYLYPYNAYDGREDLAAGDDMYRVLRGGAFNNNEGAARCAVRNDNYPYYRYDLIGFRVVVSPF